MPWDIAIFGRSGSRDEKPSPAPVADTKADPPPWDELDDWVMRHDHDCDYTCASDPKPRL